jgi:hypothetical protein
MRIFSMTAARWNCGRYPAMKFAGGLFAMMRPGIGVARERASDLRRCVFAKAGDAARRSGRKPIFAQQQKPAPGHLPMEVQPARSLPSG